METPRGCCSAPPRQAARRSQHTSQHARRAARAPPAPAPRTPSTAPLGPLPRSSALSARLHSAPPCPRGATRRRARSRRAPTLPPPRRRPRQSCQRHGADSSQARTLRSRRRQRRRPSPVAWEASCGARIAKARALERSCELLVPTQCYARRRRVARGNRPRDEPEYSGYTPRATCVTRRYMCD